MKAIFGKKRFKTAMVIIVAMVSIVISNIATKPMVVLAEVTGVQLSATEDIVLTLGETTGTSIIATVAGEETDDKSVEWIIEDSSIVDTITSGNNITITPKNHGETTITAKTKNRLTDSCTVKVKYAEPTGVNLVQADQTIAKKLNDTSFSLTASIVPPEADPRVKWTSSKEEVATVSDGSITIVGRGQTTITAASFANSEIKKTCVINVDYADINSFSLNKTELNLYKNQKEQLTVTIDPQAFADPNVDWSIETIEGADVVDVVNGEVTAKNAGKAKVTATSSTNPAENASCIVTVQEEFIKVKIIELTGNNSKVWIGGPPIKIFADISPNNASSKELRWESNEFASVQENITTSDPAEVQVTGIAKGPANIIATATAWDGTKVSNSFSLEVVERVTKINLPPSQTIAVGEDVHLVPTLTPSTAKPKITWSSSDDTIAKVDANGVVKGLKASASPVAITATIKKEDNGELPVVATTQITVSADKPFIKTPPSLKDGTVGIAYEQQLEANHKTGDTLKWTLASTSDKLPDGLTLTEAGIITGIPKNAGTFTFWVTAMSTANPSNGSHTKAFTIKIVENKTLSKVVFSKGGDFIGATSSNFDTWSKVLQELQPNKTVYTELVVAGKDSNASVDGKSDLQKLITAKFLGVQSNNIGISYVDIKVKTTIDGKESYPEDTITPIEIILQVDEKVTSREPEVFRYHKSAQKLTKSTSKADGTYNYEKGKIYIYSRYFSTFAIAYPTVDVVTVSFNTGTGGPAVEPVYVETGKSFSTLPAVPSGYDGWYTDSNYTNKLTTSTTFDQNAVLYARRTSATSNPSSSTSTTGTATGNNPSGTTPVNAPQTGDPIDYVRAFAALIVICAGIIVLLGLKAKRK